MPNSRRRYRDRSHSHSEERDNLSLVLKRIEHRLGRLEQRRKRRWRRSGTPSVIIIILLKTAQHMPFFSPLRWPPPATRILSSGLAVETKENIIKKYLPPENSLKDSPIEQWLFGSNLDTTLKQQRSYRQLQGNLKRPFLSRKGTQQDGYKLRVPKSYQRSYPQQNILSIGQGSWPG
nr:unnamed protein product [Callosobruchus analis]